MKRENKSTIVHNNLPWGVLLWRLPEGGFLGDADGNYLSVECFKGDLAAVNNMRAAASHYGYPEGETVFMPGRGKATQSEWEDQFAAMLDGDPIPGDIPDEAFGEGSN